MKKLILLILLFLISCSPVSIKPVDKVVSTFNVAGSPAYGIVIWPHQKLIFMPDVNIMLWDVISQQPGSMYVAGDFINNDFTTLYVISYTFNDLRKVDTRIGAVTIIGKLTLHNGGGWTGMTGAKDGTMYASSTDGSKSYLYRLDLRTALTTYLGEITNAPVVIDIAITPDNVMYGLDIHHDALVRIDMQTYEGTIIGKIGFDANYSQDMDYDEAHRLLYLSAYNKDTMQGELRLANVNTGMTTLIGVFPNGDEVCAFAFATNKSVLFTSYLPIVTKYAILP